VIEALALGLAYGLSAGVAPGPLLGLVITASLRDGARAGLEVAVAPLITDIPLILVSVTVLQALSDRALGVVGLLGALLVLRIAYDTWTDARTADPMADAGRTRTVRKRRYLRRAAWVNGLSPHPPLFWLTIGGPTAVRLDEAHGLASGVVFVASFLLLLVGTKALVALLVGAMRRRVGGRGYRTLLAATAVVLAAVGVVLAYQSVRLFT
jgi:threonine/homoserine/homoserine lactone efflux protein